MKPEPMTDTITVDNPGYEPGNPDSIRKIDATRTLRDDPLGRLHARGHIADDEYEAGRKLQGYYEAAEGIGRVKAQDPSREPVDGGGAFPDVLTQRQDDALKALARARIIVGTHGEAILRQMLVERCFVQEIALWSGDGSERGVASMRRLIAGLLGALAVEFRLRAPEPRLTPVG
jgi:hypothetical protein